MTIRLYFIFIFLLFFGLSVDAQRLNADGLKMVKRVNVKWYDKEHNPIEGWSHDVWYYYGADGTLTGLDNKFSENGDFYVEKYRKEGKELKYSKIKNGKVDPYDTMRFILGYHDLIRYKIHDYAVWENDFSAIAYKKRYICAYTHSDGKPVETDFREYMMFNDMTFEWLAENIEREFGNIWDMESMERDCGMKRELHIFLDEKGIFYYPEEHDKPYNTRSYSYFNGNMQEGYAKREADLNHINVYSDKINDTNIEFFGFGKLSLNEPARYVEWSTEWINARSNNLILFENKRRKNAEITYEYSEDANGNIVQIKATYTEGGPIHGIYCIMDVEYVY